MEIQGWYRPDDQSERLRVRLSIEGRSLCLYSLGGELLAGWLLARLENRGIPFWGRDWPIGDRELPEPTLTVENDEDYAVIRAVAPGLSSPSIRTRRRLLLWPDVHGNLKAGPALIWAMLVALGLTAWRLLPF
jgi:hypothetical protein